MSLTTLPPAAPELEQNVASGDRPAPSPSAATGTQFTLNIPLLLVLAAALIYCAAAYRIAATKEPFTDEGWFADPAYNLAFHGSMGSPALEPTGTWLTGELKGVRQYTYFIMPLDILAQAAWYRIAGFGLTQMRLLSALWGALALLAWYVIVERLSRSVVAGSLTVFLLACDFTFLWSAADGRMDMMCVALGSAALAVYLQWRERNFDRAVFAANCLAAASVFTHPNGVVWVALLSALVLLHDWRRLRPRNLAAALPYLVFLAGWGLYIARRPDYFLAQFSANLHPPTGARGFGLLHPLWSLRLEWSRYAAHFGDALWAFPVPRWAICIPFLLWAICIAAAIRWIRNRDQGLGTMLLLLSICLGLMLFADSLKAENYLGMIMPLYAAVAAVWFTAGAHRGKGLRYALLGLLLMFQLGVLGKKLATNSRRDDFDPTVAFVKSLGNAQVNADSVFGFDLGYGSLTDDARLGFHSGRKPDVIVADRWYVFDWQIVFPNFDRPAWTHIHDLLIQEYHPVFGRGPYVVFERNGWSPPATAAIRN